MHINWRQMFLAALVPASVELIWSLYNTYVPLWLQAGSAGFADSDYDGLVGFGLGAFATGLALTLGNVLILLISPMVGMLSDATSSRFGRRKPWFSFPAPFAMLALILLPLAVAQIPVEGNGQTAVLIPQLTIFIIVLILFLLAFAVMRTPASAILYDITHSRYRSVAAAVSGVAGGVAAVAGSAVGAILFKIAAPLPFWCAAAFVGVGIGLPFFWLKEPAPLASPGSAARLPRPPLTASLKTLSPLQARSVTFLFLNMLLTFGAFGIFQTFISSFSVRVLHLSAGDSALLYATGAMAFLLTAFPASYLSTHWLTRKQTQIVGLAIFIASSLAIYGYANSTTIWGWVLINGASLSVAMVTQEALMIDSSPSDLALGTFASLIQMARYLAYVVMPILGGWMIESAGNDYNLIWLMMAFLQGFALIAAIPVKTGEARNSQHERRAG